MEAQNAPPCCLRGFFNQARTVREACPYNVRGMSHRSAGKHTNGASGGRPLQCMRNAAPFGGKSHKPVGDDVRDCREAAYRRAREARAIGMSRIPDAQKGYAQTCRGRRPRRPASPTHKTAAHKPVGAIPHLASRAKWPAIRDAQTAGASPRPTMFAKRRTARWQMNKTAEQ